MTSKRKTASTPNADLVPAPTAGDSDPNKRSPPLYVRSTVSNPSSQDPTTILVAVPINTTIPDANKNPVDPNEAFKNQCLQHH